MRNVSKALVIGVMLGIGPASYASAQQPRDASAQTVSMQDNNLDSTRSTRESTDWGWLGLAGLVGLAGLRRRESQERQTVRNADAQPSTVR